MKVKDLIIKLEKVIKKHPESEISVNGCEVKFVLDGYGNCEVSEIFLE